MRRHPLETLPVLLSAAVLLLAACGGTEAPMSSGGPALAEHTIAQLDPQPPVLPGAATPRRLPELEAGPGIEPQTIEPAAPTQPRVALEMLVIGAEAGAPELHAWHALLDQFGIPYDTLISTEEDLTEAYLVDGTTQTGRYQAILLATDSLGYQSDGGWALSFTPEEWEILWAYQRDFGVRQVALYAYPGAYPESFGLELVEAGVAPEGYAVEPTAAGRVIFDELTHDVTIPFATNTFRYASRIADESDALPLLEDAAGNVLAAISTSPDGRERLATTIAHAAYGGVPLLHTQLLGPALIRWASKGVHLGERRLHFDGEIDDWFNPGPMWDVDTNSYIDDGFFLSAADATSFAEQQEGLQSAYPSIAPDFTWVMAFNGEHAVQEASTDCGATAATPEALSQATKCVAGSFRWVNHTFTHAYMDRNPPHTDIGYEEILAEIELNDALVEAFGFGPTYDPLYLVTGDISGLGWHAPEGPGTGPKVDYGLEASNPDLLQATVDTGRKFLASNMSVASHEPACAGCGIFHPLEPDLMLLPRWPTNVFVGMTTPEQAVDAYNAVYGPNGTEPYYPQDLTYDEYLDVESGIALAHVLSGSPYPHYFHIPNLNEYEEGRSILTDYADALFAKLAELVDVPVRTLPRDAVGAYVAARTSFASADASGVWDREAGTITVSAGSGGTVFLTGGSLGQDATDEVYGGHLISEREFAPGESVTIGDAPQHTLALGIDGAGLGLVVSNPFGIACAAGTCDAPFGVGAVVTLTPVPIHGSTFEGWSGACGGTGACRVLMDADTTVTATFAAP